MKALTAQKLGYVATVEHTLFSPFRLVGGRYFDNYEIYPY